MRNIGNELSTYPCMRNIQNIVNIYIVIKTCTKHDIRLKSLISLQIMKKSPINLYSDSGSASKKPGVQNKSDFSMNSEKCSLERETAEIDSAEEWYKMTAHELKLSICFY